MSFGFGLSLLIDRVERVLPGVVGIVGVVGIDGGDVAEVPPVTAVVIGDTVDIPTVGASITWGVGGGAFLLPLAAFSRARRTAICVVGFALSLSENLHARIASGTVDLGHRSRYTTVCAMRLSASRLFLDMLRKTFRR